MSSQSWNGIGLSGSAAVCGVLCSKSRAPRSFERLEKGGERGIATLIAFSAQWISSPDGIVHITYLGH